MLVRSGCFNPCDCEIRPQPANASQRPGGISKQYEKKFGRFGAAVVESNMQVMEQAYADPLGGVIGALGILLALHNRQRTGEGPLVDYAQLEGLVQLLGPAFYDYIENGRVAGPSSP